MKIRLMLVFATAVVAAFAIQTASAVAATCTAEKGAWCIANSALELLESVLLLGKKEAGTKSELESLNPVLTITCTTATPLELLSGGGFGEPGVVLDETKTGIEVLGFIIDFEVCSVVGHAECKVGKVETLPIVGKGPATKEKELNIEFSTETGTEFAEVTITECEQAAKIKVKTEAEKAVGQICSVNEPEVEALTKLLICTAAGSKLLVGALAATFTLTEELEGPEPERFWFNEI